MVCCIVCIVKAVVNWAVPDIYPPHPHQCFKHKQSGIPLVISLVFSKIQTKEAVDRWSSGSLVHVCIFFWKSRVETFFFSEKICRSRISTFHWNSNLFYGGGHSLSGKAKLTHHCTACTGEPKSNHTLCCIIVYMELMVPTNREGL